MTGALCGHSADEHQSLLERVTAVVFTRDKPREVLRLVDSLLSGGPEILVLDNGRSRANSYLATYGQKVTWVHSPGSWGLQMATAGDHIRTPYACIVDDDGLLNLSAVGEAVCLLEVTPQWTAVEGVLADYVMSDGNAYLCYGFSPSPMSLEWQPSPLRRVEACLEGFAESMFYSVFRSEVLDLSLRTKSVVHDLCTTRNAPTPSMQAVAAAAGPHGHLRRVLTLREVLHPPFDPHLLAMWFGDWYWSTNFADEVAQFRAFMLQQFSAAGMPADDAAACLKAFDQFAEVHRHPVATPTGRVRRGVSKAIATLRRRPRGGSEPRSTGTTTPVRVGGCARDLDYPPSWNEDDLRRFMHTVGAGSVKVVERPRDMPAPGA